MVSIEKIYNADSDVPKPGLGDERKIYNADSDVPKPGLGNERKAWGREANAIVAAFPRSQAQAWERIRSRSPGFGRLPSREAGEPPRQVRSQAGAWEREESLGTRGKCDCCSFHVQISFPCSLNSFSTLPALQPRTPATAFGSSEFSPEAFHTRKRFFSMIP